MATEPWTVKRNMTGTVELAAGEKVWVFYGPQGGRLTLAEVAVPTGKKWTVTVLVDVSETDA